MFTDLGKDWSSGPPSDYFTWVPMRYAVNLDLRNYVINTYVNDHNIIDKPLLQEENGLPLIFLILICQLLNFFFLAALLTLRGASLRNENIIMSDKFRPACTSFPFSIDAPDVTLSLTLPKWSTHRLQTMEPTTKLMTVGLLHLDGSYLYFSDVREENVDQLRLNFTVRGFLRLEFRNDLLIAWNLQLNDTIFKCLAWSIRHFMIFQQNYFGTFTHFSTLGEYLQKRAAGQIGDPIDLTYRPGTVRQFLSAPLLNPHSQHLLPHSRIRCRSNYV